MIIRTNYCLLNLKPYIVVIAALLYKNPDEILTRVQINKNNFCSFTYLWY